MKHIFFLISIVAVTVTFSCNDPELDDLIPQRFNGSAKLIADDVPTDHYVAAKFSQSDNCSVNIDMGIFNFGSPSQLTNLFNVPLCGDFLDTMQVVSFMNGIDSSSDLPHCRMIFYDSDIISAGYLMDTFNSNWMIINSYDETSRQLTFQFELSFVTAFENFPKYIKFREGDAVVTVMDE